VRCFISKSITTYHCPALNVTLGSSIFRVSAFTVDDRLTMSVIVALDRIYKKYHVY